jgi:DNA mismatch repair ATPase MutS
MPQWRVFSAIKISDDLLDDTSYYYEEVKTIKKLISECASGNTNLFLLDEIFKGTNTVERIASGKAVLSHLSQNGNTVLVSTHDLELIELLRDSYNYYHFSESVENDVLIFDYKLKPGRLTNTNAIRILEINKFPEEITEEAKALALKIKRQKERTIKKE